MREKERTFISHIVCREDLIGKVSACFERQLFGEHEGVIAIKENSLDLLQSAPLAG